LASIKDVAKRAGVGIGTVSRVLNASGYVAKETRERIEAAIAELDFTPNQLARNFGKLRNSLVGIIVPDIAHPFFGEFIRYAEMDLYRRGYKIVVCSTSQKSDREREFLGMLKRSAVDGIITGSHSLDIEEYLSIKLPIVALDRRIGPGIPVICSDHQKGGRLAAQKLLRAGCRHIAQFTTDNLVSTPARDRHTVFAETLGAAGMDVYNLVNTSSRFDIFYHLEQADRLFNEYGEVDGVFGVDLMASAVFRAAVQRGIPVPEKLKILGYDGSYIMDLAAKAITTVVQPIAELAACTVNAIIDRIEERPFPREEIILDVCLREGETV
jgi:LacI family sucrose operon transcriptional repressor